MQLLPNSPVSFQFIGPHFDEALGCDVVSSRDIATSLEMSHSNVVTLIRRLKLRQDISILAERSILIEGSITPREVIILSVEDAKVVVMQTSSKANVAYHSFLSPTPVAPLKHTFVEPHYDEKSGCHVLSSRDIAISLGMEHRHLVTLIRRLALSEDVRITRQLTETIEGSHIPREVLLLSVDDAKLVVTQSSTKLGIAYCRFLISCESQMRDLQAKAASNPLAVAISQINSDPMAAYSVIEQVLAKAKEETQKRLEAERLAAYSQAALTSSQANTRQQTKLVHDLEAKLAQRDRKLSVRQWLSISGCGPVKSTTKIVELLEALGFEAEKLIIGDDKWPSKVFPKYAFDDNADRIKTLINQQ